MPKGTSFKDHLLTQLKQPKFAAEYIQSVLEENDSEFFIEALGDVVKAHGIAHVSEATGIARQAVYQMLSSDGNPTIKNVHKILDQLGLELTVKPKKVS